MRLAVRLTAKLVHRLVALGVLLVVALGALGGAAALGSTLFETPPRDADELAERARAEAREDSGVSRQTAAEERFARRLNDLCGRHRRELRGLGAPAPTSEIPGWSRRTRPVVRRQLAEIADLRAPRSYRAERRQAVELRERALVLWGRTAELVGAGGEDGVETLIAAAEDVERRSGELLAGLGAPACAPR